MFFSHSQRGTQFPSNLTPLFLFSSLPFIVVFNYGLPYGFEFKGARFHLYIMYVDGLDIISGLKEIQKN